MDYIEMVMKNIVKKDVKNLIFNCLHLAEKDIIRSHFFDQNQKQDLIYQEITSFSEYILTVGTCYFYLKKLRVGCLLKDVMLLLVIEKEYCDLTIQVLASEFEVYSIQECQKKCRQLCFELERIYSLNTMEEIIIGYEPVEDDDMKLISFSENGLRFFNENYVSKFAASVFYIVQDKMRNPKTKNMIQ